CAPQYNIVHCKINSFPYLLRLPLSKRLQEFCQTGLLGNNGLERLRRAKFKEIRSRPFMTDTPNRYEAMIRRLSASPAWAGISEPGKAVLVWDLAVERLLWASPAAEGLQDAFAA